MCLAIMRAGRILGDIVLVGLVVGSSSCAHLIGTPSPPISKSDLLGTWVGYSTGYTEFLRLDLRDDGQGYLAISRYSSQTEAQLCKVEKWQLRKLNIEILLLNPGESIFVQNVSYRVNNLRFEFGGMRWKREATLFREREFTSQNEQLKRRIQAQEAPQTNSAIHITVIKYCLDPFRTFEIVGTDVKGVTKLHDLTKALRRHKKLNPNAKYEVLAEVKSTPEAEREMVKAIAGAGIELEHFWAATSSLSSNGPYGSGFVDHIDRHKQLK